MLVINQGFWNPPAHFPGLVSSPECRFYAMALLAGFHVVWRMDYIEAYYVRVAV
jgi:hypothetical protein